MPAKETPNQKYWDVLKQKQIRDEYAHFLTEEGRENDPHSAQLFAMKKIAGGFDYMGMRERDLILLLAGRLPYMYD
jgi:hypothetical protein